MRRSLTLAFLICAALTISSAGGAAAVSPTFRMEIVHAVQGCHVWKTPKTRGPSQKIVLKRGTRLSIRVSCPMAFDFSQVAGPKLALGVRRSEPGTVRTIVFKKTGVYKLIAKNVQSSEEQGLQTLGPDNLLKLTIVVR
jgi:hypothetical protein